MSGLKDSAYRPFAFPAPPPSYDQRLPGLNWVGNIPVLYIKVDPKRPTLLYSHGNGCDLGQIKDLIEMFSERLEMNIISYDYPGYGLSPGTPSETSCYQTIANIYNFLVSEQIPDIILMGQSIGTGPTTWLAKELSQRGLSFKSVILITPFISALSVASTTARSVSSALDIFDNQYHLSLINRPVQIIAGTDDRVTPFSHARLLQRTARYPLPMISVIGAGHNEIFDSRYRDLVFIRIKEVII